MIGLWRRLRSVDWVLVVVPAILTAFGLVMIYTLGLAQNRLGLFWNQVTYSGIAAVLFVLAAAFDYRALRYATPLLYLATLALLVAVAVAGHTVFGATRWIDIGPFQLQPSELMKLMLILTAARMLSDGIGQVSWRQFAGVLIVAMLPVGLVLQQPDLGSASVLLALTAVLLLASRLSLRQLFVSVLLIVLVAGAGWLSLRDYQRSRIEVFLHGSTDPQGSSYNVRQSIIAVGSGGLFGQGIGRGSQSQLHFLPVAHTDFMFATMAEATGFLGAAILLALYSLLIWRIWRIASLTSDPFAMLVAVGVGALLLIQVLVNVGMNIGLLPVTGIPLPFVSHGGSSLITTAIMIGILESAHLRRHKIQFHS